MEYQKCPVCEGRGSLPKGFYGIEKFGTSSDLTPEMCKTCNGKGIILKPEIEITAEDERNFYKKVFK